MQAIITPEFLQGIPVAIRNRLKLRPGVVLDFDEQAPYLKAMPVASGGADEPTEFQAWLSASTGLAKGKLTTDERMNETRGED